MIGLKIILGSLAVLIAIFSCLVMYYAYKKQYTDAKLCFAAFFIVTVLFVMSAILSKQLHNV